MSCPGKPCESPDDQARANQQREDDEIRMAVAVPASDRNRGWPAIRLGVHLIAACTTRADRDSPVCHTAALHCATWRPRCVSIAATPCRSLSARTRSTAHGGAERGHGVNGPSFTQLPTRAGYDAWLESEAASLAYLQARTAA